MKGFAVRIYGNLIINGDGYWGDGDGSVGYLFDLYDNGTLTVNGNGTFESSLTCVQLYDNAKATINGGTWVGGAYNNRYWTINKIDETKKTTSVEITGGTFIGFDPSNALTENPAENWVADGYESVQHDSEYIVVPQGSTPATTSEEAKSALADATVTKVYLTAGTYDLGTLAVTNKEIVGADNVVISMPDVEHCLSDNGNSWDNVVCKNITFNVASKEDYTGFKHSGTLTFEDCTFNGFLCSYGTETYKNCTFNDGAPYNMWVYDGSVVCDGCTFNSAGKFLNVYNEGKDNLVKLEVKDCVFNSTKANKPAINIKETGNGCNLKFNVSITNCTLGTDDFPKETNGGLWQVDDRVTSGTPDVTVIVDGKVVWKNGAAVE